jgi:hypothetical protein
MHKVRHPFIIDVEASGFGARSYPIEVGVALGDADSFCTLILPAPHWTHWDVGAEKVHRIARDILVTYGKPLKTVAQELNKLLIDKIVYSDGWVVDRPWLTTLFHAAGEDMKFQVSPLEIILSEAQMAIWHDTRDKVIGEMQRLRHRASFDAWLIQETYKRTLLRTATN